MYDKRSRMQKAFDLVEAGKVSKSVKKGLALVNGSTNITYEVNLNDLTCRIAGGRECDDMKFNCDVAKGELCKHIFAAQLITKSIKVPIR